MTLEAVSQNVETQSVHARASRLGGHIYSTLDEQSSQTRIFTLLPSNNRSAMLEGHLTVEQLSEKPQYEALPYVWGESPQDNAILVDGCDFLVARNLFEAVLELRYSTKFRRLWIDVICIDQANVHERNHQVSQMRSIYSTASRVLIWLGEFNTDTRKTMAMLQDCKGDEWSLPEDKPILRGMVVVTHPEFTELLTRPWFSRMWTVQELLVANMDPLVGSGNQWVPWNSIWTAFRSLIRNRRGWPLFSEHEEHGLSWLMSSRRGFQTDKTIALKELIMATNMHESPDPRDRIFALSGLVDQETKQSISTDYSLSKSAVYQKATLALWRQGSALDLRFLNGNYRDNVLPTWCIDFSHGKCGPDRGASYISSILPEESDFPLVASSKSLKILGHDVHLGTLELEGCLIGTVQDVVSSQISPFDVEGGVDAYSDKPKVRSRLIGAHVFTAHALNAHLRELLELKRPLSG